MYFNATVQIVTEGKNGNVKKSNEHYLLEAVSYTDAEKKITEAYFGVTFNWSIKKLNISNIKEIIT